MKNIYFKSILLFPAFIALLFSCRFSSDEYYFVELDKPNEPELQVVELSLNQDTIVLAEFQEVRFNFNAGEYKVIEVGVLIDGEEKYTSSNYQGSFTLLTNDISEGTHKLSFSVITNSNSGSIADLLGAEGYQFISNEWTLICIKNDRLASYATTQVENGKLKLNWEPHEKINFRRYRIAKSRNYYSAPIKEYYTTEPFFIDEAYVGEKAHYDIYVEYYSTDFYLQWAELEIENTLPEIKIRITNDNHFEAYWEDNDFTPAIENYRLIQVPTPVDTILLTEIPPGEKNSYIIPDGVFANEINYKLVVVPKYPENPFNNDELYYHSKSFDGLLGEKSFAYQQISSINTNELLVLKDGIIYRYSKPLGKNTDSLSYNWDHCQLGYGRFSVSPNGTYFTTRESCNNNLVLMNPANLNNYQSYSVSQAVPQGMLFNSMPVSDNGIVVAKDYEQVSVYDVLNNRLIDSYASNAYIYNIGISASGNYFYVQTSSLAFYTINDDTIASIWNSPPAYNYIYSVFTYDPQNPENIILFDGETLYHKNAADFSTLKSFALKEDMILNFDFPTRKLLAYSENYLSVYSIDSGELLNRVKADPRVMLTQHRCKLALNTIFLGDGIRIQLPNN